MVGALHHANLAPRTPEPALTPDLWIFGYGSLMWRPELPFAERASAVVQRYHRAFCVTSTHHRGTETRPGLVLGLDLGGACTGIAYRIPAGHRAATLAYLRERELIYGVYREAHVAARLIEPARREVSALAYIVERSHPSYAGRLALAEQARRIRAASGISGANLDYLVNTVHHLQDLGIRERALERLMTVAAGPARRGDRNALVRPAVAALSATCRARSPETPPMPRDQRRRFCYRWRIGRI